MTTFLFYVASKIKRRNKIGFNLDEIHWSRAHLYLHIFCSEYLIEWNKTETKLFYYL